MVSVEEAQEIILKTAPTFSSEKVRIIDSLDRILAQDLYADVAIPSFDNSAMDGYAVSSIDVAGASQQNPVVLNVIEDLPAGGVAKQKIRKGDVIKIMTGAPIPESADSVIMVEKTQLEGRKVKIFESTKPGENIRQAGEDIKKGELVLKKGQIIGPAQMGILASMGKETVEVVKRPRVGILATGDELVEVEESIALGKIRNSNTYSLYGQVKKAGGIPYNLGIARDNKQSIRAKIEEGLDCDLLLISGGVSVGDYDYVKLVLTEMDAEIKFWKVAMRPGKPTAFGIVPAKGGSASGRKGKPVFGLPGNPVSSMVCFEVFVRPTILKIFGQNINSRKEVEAILEEDIKKKKGFRYFLRGQTHWEHGVYLTKTTGPQGSGILKSMAQANSLMILPEDEEMVERGRRVTVRFLD